MELNELLGFLKELWPWAKFRSKEKTLFWHSEEFDPVDETYLVNRMELAVKAFHKGWVACRKIEGGA